MAIRRKPKKRSTLSTSPSNKWQARPDDAIRLAALRWFGLEMERVSIELYASDPDLYASLEAVMRQTLKDLYDMRRQIAVEDDECPEGYILCKDRTCSPMCDPFVAKD